MLQLLLALALVALLAAYWAVTWNYSYWKKRGIPYPTPTLFWGNLGDSIWMKKCMGQIYNEIYNQFTDCAYVGIYKIRTPALLLRDIELIRNVLVKDFVNFHDVDIEVDEKVDPIMAKNPFCLKGKEWKTVRLQLSPSFTPGKMKPMFEYIRQVGENMTKYLEQEKDASGRKGLEAKELSAKYTTDVVATLAFGVEGNCFRNPKSEFREMGKKILAPSLWTGIKHLIVLVMPLFAKIMKVRFFPEDVAKFFRNTVNQILEFRAKNNVQRNDFMDLMIQLKSKLGEHEFNNEHIAAHASTIFAEGFHTSSTAMAFILFELAANQDIQDKVRAEMVNVLEKHEGKLSYDALQDMVYLESVFCEGLRIHSPVFSLSRVCTERYVFPPVRGPGKGPDLVVEPGVHIVVPADAIHHDPKYFPDPRRFNPDRFSEDNKKDQLKCSFLAFGEGPRICMGQKLANVQSKAGLVAILTKFVVRVNSRTIAPIQHDPRMFMLEAKGGIWLNFYKI